VDEDGNVVPDGKVSKKDLADRLAGGV